MKFVQKFWHMAMLLAPILVIITPYSYAQSAKINENPFEFARNLAESGGASALHSQQPNSIGPEIRQATAKPQLQYREKAGRSKVQTKRLLEGLTQKFGPPKSVRGANHVWEIENPDTGLSQSKLITIILSVDRNGSSELIMDRNRGEDGRATWALPRREVSQGTSLRKQEQRVKRAPLVNPD